MDPNAYQRLAARTECDYAAAARRSRNADSECGLFATRLKHAAVGMADEVGEFCKEVEKHFWYGQDLDRENLREELGDLLWYVALACRTLGVSLDDVLDSNIRKLRMRYPLEFTHEAALEENRDRKAERRVISPTAKRRARAEDNGPDYERDEYTT